MMMLGAPLGLGFWPPATQVADLITSAPNPAAEAEALLTAFREIKKTGSLAPLERSQRWDTLRQSWDPFDNVQNLAAYAAIVITVLTIWQASQQKVLPPKVEINQIFDQQYELISREPEKFGVGDLIDPKLKRL